MLIHHLTSVTRATCRPLHLNSRACWWFPSPHFINDGPPRAGKKQGLKYDRNLSVSLPSSSLYCTARPPRVASNSIALAVAAVNSSWAKEVYFKNASFYLYTMKIWKPSMIHLLTWLASFPIQKWMSWRNTPLLRPLVCNNNQCDTVTKIMITLKVQKQST